MATIGVVGLAGDVDDLAVRRHRHALGLVADLHALRDGAGRAGRPPTSPPSPRSRRRATCRRARSRRPRDPGRCGWCGRVLRVAMSTTPMPSAERSAGGSVDSSTPGGAIGDPDSATYSCVPSRDTRSPRGRLPTGMRGEHAARRRIDDRDRPRRLVAHVDALRRRRRRRRRVARGTRRPPRRSARPPGSSDAPIDDAGRPWLLVQREGVERVVGRDQDVLAPVEHVGRRRVGDVADVRVPDRRAGDRVLGDEVAAVVAGEHQLAGGRQQAGAAAAVHARPPAAGYGRRHAILPVSGSIAVRKLPVLPTNTSSLPARPIEPRGSGSVR